METTIYYYTGTGNSLWVARTLGHELGGAELVCMADAKENEVGKVGRSGAVGLVFPVHMWGLPARVIRFAETLGSVRPEYSFAVAVNAGQVSNTLVQLKRLLAKKGVVLSSGFEIKTPSNYIPWGGPGPMEKQKELFDAAKSRMSQIAGYIGNQEQRAMEKGPLWHRVFFSLLYKLSFSQVSKMDRQFRADEKCNQCGICSRVCPSGNIAMEEKGPAWGHRCEQCLACLQWCPKEAIQYGKKTPAYERYHHPEVHLKEMMRR